MSFLSVRRSLPLAAKPQFTFVQHHDPIEITLLVRNPNQPVALQLLQLFVLGVLLLHQIINQLLCLVQALTALHCKCTLLLRHECLDAETQIFLFQWR